MRVDKRPHTYHKLKETTQYRHAVLSMNIGMEGKVGGSEPCRVKTENPPYMRQDPLANILESAKRPMNRFNYPVIPWLRTRAK